MSVAKGGNKRRHHNFPQPSLSGLGGAKRLEKRAWHVHVQQEQQRAEQQCKRPRTNASVERCPQWVFDGW